MPGFLTKQRWFGGKARTIRAVSLLDAAQVAPGAVLALASVRYSDGGRETYCLPLAFPSAEITDVCGDPAFGSALLDAVRRERKIRTNLGVIAAKRTRAFGRLFAGLPSRVRPVPLAAEQSNSSIIFGRKLLLKLYRRLDPGPNPELELGQFLTGRGFTRASALAGWLEYRGRGRTLPLAVMQAFVPGRDLWEATLERPLRTLRLASLLGRRTAELHLALAQGAGALASEPFTAACLGRLRAGMHRHADKALRLLRERFPALPGSARAQALAVLKARDRIRAAFDSGLRGPIQGLRIRCHGDLHLGQVILTGKDFTFIDFEGEKLKSPAERRLKRSPLYDAAGMLRSFQYAAQSARLRGRRSHWAEKAGVAFLDAYLRQARPILPQIPAQARTLLDLFCLEKALYELAYELSHRPAWVLIPLRGILRSLSCYSFEFSHAKY
ncbi:MAG: phosphotransferase [Elusimicrobia bacterium]|nr:phosphotransferase [Elusimicrobiota bacterium]